MQIISMIIVKFIHNNKIISLVSLTREQTSVSEYCTNLLFQFPDLHEIEINVNNEQYGIISMYVLLSAINKNKFIVSDILSLSDVVSHNLKLDLVLSEIDKWDDWNVDVIRYILVNNELTLEQSIS